MEFAKIVKDDKSVVMFAKMQVEGRGTGLEKHDWIKIIEGRARDLHGDSSPRSFAKTIVEDDTGKLLYRALKAAPGSEVKPAPGDTPEAERQHIGPNHAKLHSLAIDAQRASPGLSYARAVANIYETNAGLRSAVRDEHLAQSMARANGAGTTSAAWPADKVPAWR